MKRIISASFFLRVFLIFCLLTDSFVHAQMSPLSFTMNFVIPSNSITCTQTFVPVYVQDSYTLSPVSYSWTNGTAVYTGTMVNITQPGTYSVTAYVNPTLSLVQYFGVPSNTAAPTSTLTPLNQSISCNASNALVTANTSATYCTQYFMGPCGGTFVTQSSTFSYAPGVPGTYTHIVVDEWTGCSTSKTFTVTAPPGFPTFSITSAENFSVGCGTTSLTTVNIVNAISQPTNHSLSYTITPSLSYTTSAQSSYSFSILSAGNYSVIVHDDVTSCESRMPLTVIANTDVPSPNVVNFGSDLTCGKQKVWFQIYQVFPGNYTFGWSTNTAVPFYANHPFDSITVFANFNPSVTAMLSPWAVVTNNQNKCTIAFATFIDLDMLPPFVTMKSNYNGIITCQHPYVTLTCTAQSSWQGWNAGIVGAYLWQGPPPQSNGTLSSGYLAYAAGIYTVHVIDSKSGCTNTDTILIKDNRVYPQVIAPLQPFELCNSLITIQPVNSSTVPLLFAWNSGTNSILSNTTLSQVAVGSTGIYIVLVTDPVTSCSVSVQLTVSICTGVVESYLVEPSFSIYPNPVTDYIIVESNGMQSIKLLDAQSRLVEERKIETGITKLTMEAYAAGIYFLQFQESSGKIRTVKMIKKN